MSQRPDGAVTVVRRDPSAVRGGKVPVAAIQPPKTTTNRVARRDPLAAVGGKVPVGRIPDGARPAPSQSSRIRQDDAPTPAPRG